MLDILFWNSRIGVGNCKCIFAVLLFKLNKHLRAARRVENCIADDKDESRELLEAVKDLGEPDSTIFIRKYYFGQKNIDIAKELHMSKGTVNMRISRGLKKLKKILEGRE